MKKTIKYILAIMFIIFIGNMIKQEVAYASSADIKITADGTEVVLGDEFNAYINISSDITFGDFEAYLVYDAEVLEYIDGASVIRGGGGFLNISDINTSEEGKSRKYALRFKAIKTGSSQLDFQNRVMLYDYENNMEIPVSTNTLTIEVKAKTVDRASNNTYLKTLKVVPGKLEPAFDKDVYSYRTTVGSDVDQLILEALAEDSEASVKIRGNNSLEEGENEVVIEVTAESGITKQYKITVLKEESPIGEEDEPDEPTPEPEKEEFEINKVGNDLIISYQDKTYKIVEPDESVIPSGYEKTQIDISDYTVEVYYPVDKMNSDIVLIYAMDEQGQANFYSFSKSEKTLELFIDQAEKEDDLGDDQDEDEDDTSYDEYKSSRNKAIILIAILAVVAIVVIILFIRLHLNNKNDQY